MELIDETDPRLRTPCDPFDFSSPAFDPEAVSRDMLAIMLQHNGVGLAAPQVGLGHRLFLMGDDHGNHIVCINPEIVEVSPSKFRDVEGCLSFPKLWLKIERPEWLVARFWDTKGRVVEQQFVNLFARCYAHELNHLDGIVFTDLAGPLALKMAKDKRSKLLKTKK